MDYNQLQIDGTNDQVLSIGDIVDKFRAFGWECGQVDGHDVAAITAALNKPAGEKPRFLLCHTVKGKGVTFMENQVGWHGKPMNQEQYEAAMREMGV